MSSHHLSVSPSIAIDVARTREMETLRGVRSLQQTAVAERGRRPLMGIFRGR